MRVKVMKPNSFFVVGVVGALLPCFASAQALPPPPAPTQPQAPAPAISTAPAMAVERAPAVTDKQAQPLAVAQPSEDDLAALRYFIDREDEPAIFAEQERLARRFPDADIDRITERLQSGEVFDTTGAWELINQDRFDEARAEIVRLQGIDPGWQPPPEMNDIIRQREGQSVLEAAFLRRDLNAAIQAAQTYPELVTCERVNTPWRLAELMTDYQQIQSALDTYLSTAVTCADINVIVASLQKGHAIANSPDWTKGAFAAAIDRHPTHTQRLEDELLVLVGPPEEEVEPAPVVVTRLDLARNATNRRDYNECLRLLQGRTSPAEQLARGWCAHNLGQSSQAQAAFNAASAKGSGSVRREARFGLTLSYFSVGEFAQGKALMDTTRFSRSEQKVVDRIYLGAAAQNAFERRRYRDTLAYLDNLTLRGQALSRGQLMIQGWSLARTGRTNDARQVFRTVQATAPGSDVETALSALNRTNSNGD